jgi:predicted Zn-dependent protease
MKHAAANDWSLAYATGLADQKDMAGVRAAIANMTDLESLAQIAEDRRFEPLWAEMQAKGRFDWKALMTSALAADRAAVAVNLDRAGPADVLMQALIRDEQLPAALTIGERWRKTVEAGRQIPDADSADWVLDHYGDALVASGRADEAAAVYKMANDMDLDPVSHRLNWAQHLLTLGRFDDALKALAEIDATKTSPAGQLWIKEGQACANAKEHPEVAAKLADEIRGRAKQNPQALEATLLCLNKVDEAADLYAKRFADPDQRADALAAARKGPAPKDATPFETELDVRKQAALAKPQAAKALAAVGRRLDAPVQLTSFRNY